MRLGIMQPYFFPYIGYWQLMNAVDKYVVYDDVNFIKGGWVHRNRILSDGRVRYFNVPLRGASAFKHINEIGVNPDPRLRARNRDILRCAYRHAPYYGEVMPLLEGILNCESENLAEYLISSIQTIRGYLGIQSELLVSSELPKDCNLRGQEKVLAICELLGADEYLNAIGGQALYAREEFRRRGIELRFLHTGEIVYPQFGEEFQPNLSIIDVMMFNSPAEIHEMLGRYTLLE